MCHHSETRIITSHAPSTTAPRIFLEMRFETIGSTAWSKRATRCHVTDPPGGLWSVEGGHEGLGFLFKDGSFPVCKWCNLRFWCLKLPLFIVKPATFLAWCAGPPYLHASYKSGPQHKMQQVVMWMLPTKLHVLWFPVSLVDYPMGEGDLNFTPKTPTLCWAYDWIWWGVDMRHSTIDCVCLLTLYT